MLPGTVAGGDGHDSYAARRRNLACRPPALATADGAHESLPHHGASSARRTRGQPDQPASPTTAGIAGLPRPAHTPPLTQQAKASPSLVRGHEDVKPHRRDDSRRRQAQAGQPQRDILAAAHIRSGRWWQRRGPHEMVATSRRGDELPRPR